MNRFRSSISKTGIISFLAAFALTASVIATSAAQAHGIWFAQRATQLALLYGIGADDLDSVKRLPLVKSGTTVGRFFELGIHAAF